MRSTNPSSHWKQIIGAAIIGMSLGIAAPTASADARAGDDTSRDDDRDTDDRRGDDAPRRSRKARTQRDGDRVRRRKPPQRRSRRADRQMRRGRDRRSRRTRGPRRRNRYDRYDRGARDRYARDDRRRYYRYDRPRRRHRRRRTRRRADRDARTRYDRYDRQRRRRRRATRRDRYDRDDDHRRRRAHREHGYDRRSISRSSASMMRPGTRSHSLHLGLAPIVGTRYDPQFSLQLGYHYHFFGTYAGPSLGAVLKFTASDEGYTAQTLARFAWNIQLGGGGLDLTPYIGLGHMHTYRIIFGYYTEHELFAMQAGLALTFMLGDRVALSIHAPVEFNIGAVGLLRFSPTASLGVTF